MSPTRELTTFDLRSDTITRPDPAMRDAMRAAEVGDDVFGDDPTVLALEAKAVEVTGKEAALLVPSGTMANAIAIGALTRPGDEVILEANVHSYHFECGGASRLWGVQARPIPGRRGQMPLGEIEAAIRADDIHMPRTRLVVVEQTSNVSGGCVLPLSHLEEVRDMCRRHGLALHVDGARVFNASVASGVPVREYASCADTLMFCLSKGLGAPVGSILTGPAALMGEARRLRKLLGGGMRQAGVLAACGLLALERNVQRLEEDHRRARELAAALEPLRSLGLEIVEPETNMVYVSWPGKEPTRYARCLEALEALGVRAVAIPGRGIRFVFHKDVPADPEGRLVEAVRGAIDEQIR